MLIDTIVTFINLNIRFFLTFMLIIYEIVIILILNKKKKKINNFLNYF
jgi:hypothetical protein